MSRYIRIMLNIQIVFIYTYFLPQQYHSHVQKRVYHSNRNLSKQLCCYEVMIRGYHSTLIQIYRGQLWLSGSALDCRLTS